MKRMNEDEEGSTNDVGRKEEEDEVKWKLWKSVAINPPTF
jgi:hypothetical protein